MKCPIDGSTLVISDRNGIEIDYCPQCRGIWLDRGELDKIIERSEAAMPPSAPGGVYGTHGGHDDRYGPGGKRKKKGGFLSEVFDIFD